MNTDFRLAIGFVRHHKTRKLMRKLKDRGFYSLVCLFDYAAYHCPDGRLLGFTKEDVADVASWGRAPLSAFVDVLLEVGFLEEIEGGYIIHDWQEHNPDAERNALRTEAPMPCDWNRRRYAVFLRDDFTCRYCGIRIEKPHCDHVIPRSRGGADTIDNLVTACPDCNRRKSDKTPEEWMQ